MSKERAIDEQWLYWFEQAKTLMEFQPCNVSGVVFSFAKFMQFLCDQNIEQQKRNSHDITKAFLLALEPYKIYGDQEYSEVLARIDIAIDAGKNGVKL